MVIVVQSAACCGKTDNTLTIKLGITQNTKILLLVYNRTYTRQSKQLKYKNGTCGGEFKFSTTDERGWVRIFHHNR